MMQNGISEVGQIQNLSLPEQGITGPSRITSIKHILPQKRPVDNDENDSFGLQPITGIFVHQSEDVWALKFDNGDTLGVTYNHPVYSLTANDWRSLVPLFFAAKPRINVNNSSVLVAMKIIFQIIYNKDKLQSFKPYSSTTGDRANLQNNIGYARIYVLDEFGNLIKEFDDLLFDMVINLILGCKSLQMGEVDQGALFVMEPEWDKHLWFVLENGDYRISFKKYRDIVMSREAFHQFVHQFSMCVLSTIEYFYQGVSGNPAYLEWKAEILADLSYLTTLE
jgi:hypothetical protein